MKSTTFADGMDLLSQAGVRRGDTVLLHSHLPAFGLVEGGPETLIDALVETVGPGGTVVMPSFTLSFCKTRLFDHDKTPSEMGVLTELFRRRPGALRSLHPIHSVTALGHGADEIAGSQCLSSFGKGSAFEKMHECDAWILCAGVGAERLTFVHYIEEREKVPYRAYKAFPGAVRFRGKDDPRTFTMYSRDLRFKMDLKNWSPLLESRGFLSEYPLAYGSLRAYRAKAVYSAVRDLLQKKPGALVTEDSPIQDLLEGKIVCTP